MEESLRIGKLSDFQLLKDKVYEAIKRGIIDLSLPPDEQLVEKQLARESGVSKSPIFPLKVGEESHVMSKGKIVHSATPQELWENQPIKSRYWRV